MDAECRIVIADDHPVLRQGLRQIIDADPLFHVVGEADNGEEALAQVQALRPDIAVLDIDMPKLDGLAVAREIGRRKLPVEIMFLTIHADEDCFHAAMELGSRAFIVKESAVSDIIQGLRAIAAGQYYVSSPLTAHLLSRRSRAQSLAAKHPGLDNLTQAERRVLRGIAEGKTSKQIGSELFIHFRTVENHRTNICQKLGLHGSNSLFKFAWQHKSEL
jgi:DNA-binding NarL/FixJ family response regulator